MMFKYRIKDLIKEYYSMLNAEYSKLSPEEKKALYNSMVAKELRAKVDNKEVYFIVSNPIAFGTGEIQLYADIYVSHEFYLCTYLDLTGALPAILEYNSFKKLIYLMFYIIDYIVPIEIKPSLIYKSL